MSIHTILSQMEEEFDKKFCEYLSLKTISLLSSKPVLDKKGKYINNFKKGILPHEVKQFFRSFATRIVEEVGKELIGEDEKPDDYIAKHLTEEDISMAAHAVKFQGRNALRKEQRTKLQKMKGEYGTSK